MSKTKKLLAAALATVSLAAVPATELAIGAGSSMFVACGNNGSSTCG